jgi:pectinesterase
MFSGLSWSLGASANYLKVTAALGYSLAGKVYLGRPWRQYSHVIFQNSMLTDVVNVAGWRTLALGILRELHERFGIGQLIIDRIFEEWNNSGAGSSTSARVYETVATGPVSKSTLYGSDWKDWIDTSY